MKTTEYALLGGFLWMVATGDLKKLLGLRKLLGTFIYFSYQQAILLVIKLI